MELQRTEQWFDARKYKFTSSNMWRLMTEPRSKEAKESGELSETAKEYIMEKVVEEIGGFIPEYETNAMVYGSEHEAQAKYWYQLKTGLEIVEVGFQEVNEFYGGSPDCLVMDRTTGEIGALEIKCPYNSTNHLWHCMIDSYEYLKRNHKEYFWQCVSHMITANVDFCDFVSFDPRIDNEIGFFRYRLFKKEEDVKSLMEKLDKANQYKLELKLKLGLI
jgi:hypothetical protein